MNKPFEPISFLDIASAMRMRVQVIINGIQGVIQSITLEDGSGKNLNITLRTDNNHLHTTFCRVKS